MQELKEMQVQSLGQKDPLKEETASLPQYSRKIPWTENPGGLQSTGHKESDMTEHSSALWLKLAIHMKAYFLAIKRNKLLTDER